MCTEFGEGGAIIEGVTVQKGLLTVDDDDKRY